MQKRTIAEAWRAFRQRVVTGEMSPEQVEDVRRTFYAGAHVMYLLLVRSPPLTPKEIAAYEGELAAFLEEVKRQPSGVV